MSARPTTPSSHAGDEKRGYPAAQEPLYVDPPTHYGGSLIDLMSVEAAQAHLAEWVKRYVLEDVRDGSMFGVGETSNPLPDRLGKYITDARAGYPSRLHRRVRDILEAGLRPRIHRVYADTEAEAFEMHPDAENERAAGGGPGPCLDWPVEWVRLLGRVPDSVLAQWRGVGTSTICRTRRSMGIPSYRDWRRATRT